ncbi:MAG TPA: hypothetical protein VFP35_01715 [Candidatus Saccharimonadales bacterium]|nr:hypothetical protein [Candidatus Saccharimonadales bacterium]
MDSRPRHARARRVARRSAKLTGLILVLIIFILLIFFVLGIIFDRYIVAPSHF